MNAPRRFAQVDVFTAEPTLGNPVAVVLDGAGLTTQQMHAFTEWTNLSEATFVVPATDPSADYAVRIFCPGRELPFAGHPTLGTCHAWLEAGGEPINDHIVQECGAGLVRIRRTPDDALSFAAPPRNRTGPLEDDVLHETVRGLHLSPDAVVDHQWCDNGPGWRGLLLRSTEDLHSVSADPELLAHVDVGLIAPSSAETDFEVRAFFPGNQGITEDPVTGSLNAALGQWLIGAGLAPDSYTALQGRALSRRGLISVERILDDVWVGGRTVTVIDGTVSL